MVVDVVPAPGVAEGFAVGAVEADVFVYAGCMVAVLWLFNTEEQERQYAPEQRA